MSGAPFRNRVSLLSSFLVESDVYVSIVFVSRHPGLLRVALLPKRRTEWKEMVDTCRSPSLSLSPSFSRPISLFVPVVPAISGQSKTRTATLRSLPTHDVVESAAITSVPRLCCLFAHSCSMSPLLQLTAIVTIAVIVLQILRARSPTRLSPLLSLSTSPVLRHATITLIYICVIVFFRTIERRSETRGRSSRFPSLSIGIY